MPTIFSETIARAIGEYRLMLRKCSKEQSERMRKLTELNLNNPNIYSNDLTLYKTASTIVSDLSSFLQEKGISHKGSYYHYSGFHKFREYMEEYLNDYVVEKDGVVHKAQKASRAIIEAIQLATLPENRLDEDIAEKLEACNEIIASFGSNEQLELHESTLERKQTQNGDFYAPILQKFKQKVQSQDSVAVGEG